MDYEEYCKVYKFKDVVSEKLKSGNIVFSLTAPEAESPLPLWVYNTTIKLFVCDKWVNVGEYTGENSSDLRFNNEVIRIKE